LPHQANLMAGPTLLGADSGALRVAGAQPLASQLPASARLCHDRDGDDSNDLPGRRASRRARGRFGTTPGPHWYLPVGSSKGRVTHAAAGRPPPAAAGSRIIHRDAVSIGDSFATMLTTLHGSGRDGGCELADPGVQREGDAYVEPHRDRC
jgi:hypothetical protein